MSIDKIIFPHPKPQYTESDIPNKDETSSIQFIDSPSYKIASEINKVPIMVMTYKQYEESYDSYLLFFHGNAEDLGTSIHFLKLLRESLRMNVIAVEYPSYGIYKKKVSAEQIKVDALKVYDSLVDSGIDQSKIIVFGRSIGTGPACEIGSKRKPGGIILLSAFTSIKKLSGEIAFSLVSYFVKERFNNIENVTRFTSPCLLIHGQADNLIKHEHSKQLQVTMQTHLKPVVGYYPENMTHNQFQFRKDIMRPIESFLKGIHFQQVKILATLLPQLFQNSLQNCLQSPDSPKKRNSHSDLNQQSEDAIADQRNSLTLKKSESQKESVNKALPLYKEEEGKQRIKAPNPSISTLCKPQLNENLTSNQKAAIAQKYILQSELEQDSNIAIQIQISEGNEEFRQDEKMANLNPASLFKKIQLESQQRKQQCEEFKINQTEEDSVEDDCEEIYNQPTQVDQEENKNTKMKTDMQEGNDQPLEQTETANSKVVELPNNDIQKNNKEIKEEQQLDGKIHGNPSENIQIFSPESNNDNYVIINKRSIENINLHDQQNNIMINENNFNIIVQDEGTNEINNHFIHAHNQEEILKV